MKPKSKVLIIAGSDSSGGAGIQADIKTVTALGSYAMTAITAITAQNTTGVKSIVSIDSKEIFKQITFTCQDIKPDAIKIGMLHSSKVINSVISALNKVKISKIVLDPVMVAKGGTRLIDNKAINILKNKLIKKATLITPNICEAEILTKTKINNNMSLNQLDRNMFKNKLCYHLDDTELRDLDNVIDRSRINHIYLNQNLLKYQYSNNDGK